MRDIFFTILVIWVLFRIFSKVKVFHSTYTNIQNNNFHPPQEKKKEGEIKIEKVPEENKRIRNEDIEDVDYEEMK